MLGLWEDDDIQSADELYEASLALPWEEWVNPPPASPSPIR